MMNGKLSVSTVLRSLCCGCLCLILTACLPTTTPTPIPSPSPLSGTDEAIAIVTNVVGNVILLDPGNQKKVNVFQELKDGSRLQLSKDAKVTVICFQENVFEVDQPGEIQVTQQQCAGATPMPPNTAHYVKPDGGRIVSFDGSLALEEEVRERESDYGNIPVIVSPRNTSLSNSEPILNWIAVDKAIEYQVNLSGLASFDEITVAANKITCVEQSLLNEHQVCSIAWPTSWTLEPGQRYFLTISARIGIASPFRESESSALRTLSIEDKSQLNTFVAQVNALSIDPLTRDLLLARHYSDHKLLAEAIELYLDAYALQPTPEISVALGDLYREVDLQQFALLSYQQTLDHLADQKSENLAAQAAANTGIGLVHYNRANYVEAENYLLAATELYKKIGAETELQNIEDAIEKIREHLLVR